MHELIAAPLLGEHFVLRPGAGNGVGCRVPPMTSLQKNAARLLVAMSGLVKRSLPVSLLGRGQLTAGRRAGGTARCWPDR